MNSTLFNGSAEFLRILVVGCISVAALLILQHLERKRPVLRMSTVDVVLVVALGSTLAATLLSGVVLLEGALAVAILLGARSLVTWVGARPGGIRVLERGEPVLVAWRGSLVRRTMRRQRVGEAEVLAAARAKGVASVRDVEAAILETTGSIRIIPRYRSPARRRYISPPDVRLYRGERDR